MNFCILMGSPRMSGNTMSLLKPFTEELMSLGVEHDLIKLHEKTINPCIACRTCQKDWTIFGCRYKDDMQEIFDKVRGTDLIILATPIYSWYCTAPMKAMLDRLMYGMNKYYGEEKGPSIWTGKKLSLITTCGYKPERGADLWEEGIKRYCKHSTLQYISMYTERDWGYKSVFMDNDKAVRVRQYAKELCQEFAGQ